jgi:hypothetical protein
VGRKSLGYSKGTVSSDVKEPDGREPKREPDVDKARRKLLAALVYAAPVVVSTVVIKPAHAQATSCGPASCNPVAGCNPGSGCNPASCNPRGGACGPSNCKPRR